MSKDSPFVALLLLYALLNLTLNVEGAAIKNKERPQFVYIGKFDNQISDGVSGPGQKTRTISAGVHTSSSFYFKSQNSAGWSTAASDCKEQLGGTLLNIETEGELAAVREFIEGSDDTGSNYWIGGKYSGSAFSWDNGQVFGAWTPWDKGYPNTRLSITRVAAYTVGGLRLRTQFNTVSNRYICELNV